MREFVDIHSHLLCYVDDGAKNEKMMFDMLEKAWESGTRYLCATPHFGVRQLNGSDLYVRASFEQLREYVVDHHPEMRIFLGNELRYREGCAAWLDSGKCKTLNGKDIVLVDFPASETRSAIISGLLTLLNSGYRPIFAHAERYPALKSNLEDYRFLKDKGVKLQIDADSIFGNWGIRAKLLSRKLLTTRLANYVCSDAHDLVTRPPDLRDAFLWIEKHVSAEYAEQLNNNAKIAIGMIQ